MCTIEYVAVPYNTLCMHGFTNVSEVFSVLTTSLKVKVVVVVYLRQGKV